MKNKINNNKNENQINNKNKRNFRFLFAILVLVLILNTTGLGVLAQGSQFYIEENREIIMPDLYLHDFSIHTFMNFGLLRNPQDMFVASDGFIYLADTGNRRILKLDPDCVPIAEYLGDEVGGFGQPEGIFVSDKGEMYVADTEKECVIHFDSEGNLLGQYFRPDTPLLSQDFRFQPKKISVNITGMMYILCKAELQGLLAMQQNGEFQGIVAVEKVPFRLSDVLIRLFGTENQKKIAARQLPSAVSNFVLSEGIIYAVSGQSENQQIAIYNSIGKNLYPEGDYSFGGSLEDLTLMQGGIIAALDREKRLVRLFDQNGSNLGNFGGNGNRKGEFVQPTAIVSHSNGAIFVLDAGTAGIQKFVPTLFMENIRKATSFADNGEYEKAAEKWTEILKADETFTLAHRGIAQSNLKTRQWTAAAIGYKYVGDKLLYSQAYSEILHDFYRKYFALILACTAGVIFLIYFTVRRLRPLAAEISDGGTPGMKMCLGVLFYPVRTFENIKRNRDRLGIMFPIIITGVAIVIRIATVYFTHFPFVATDIRYSNPVLEIAILLGPVISWIVASYAVTSVQDGEMRFVECTYGVLLSLTPFLIISPFLITTSYLFESGNLQTYNFFQTFMWVWISVLLFISLKQMSGYSFFKTIRTALLSVITVAVIWFLLFIFYTMTIQITDFAQQILYEIRVR